MARGCDLALLKGQEGGRRAEKEVGRVSPRTHHAL